MSRIELPALRADNVLGFLAGCGVLCVIAEDLGDRDATLCWPDGAYGPAVVSTPLAPDHDQLSEVLFQVVETLRLDGQLIPGVDALPLASPKGGDPMNSLSFEDGRRLSDFVADGIEAQRWLVSMVGLTIEGDNGTLDRSKWWNVGPGPVTISGTLAKSMEPIVDAHSIRGALSAWRRHDWVGGYLDQAADVGKERVAGTRSKDYGVKAGVVGATWLALMATRLFVDRATSDDSHETVGWSSVNRKSVFTYPVWNRPLDLSAVRVLVDHPLLDTSRVGRMDPSALSVVEVRRSTRVRSGNNNGAMTPAERIWPNNIEK